jgi:site-specific recombinase XerD
MSMGDNKMQKERASDLLESFFQDCRFRNLSAKSLSDYQWYLNDTQKRLGNLMEIDRQGMKQLALERLDSGLSPATVNHYIKCIKVFYSFLKREEIIEQNPMEKLAKITEPKKIKPVLDENQIAKLIGVIPNQGFYHLRDKAMIMILWDCGIRLNELLSIELEHVDFQFNTIKIRGKGNKERIVPFGNKTKKAIQNYFKIRPNNLSNLLFCSRTGSKIMPRNFQRGLKRYGRKIGVSIIYPHLIRHSAATYLAKHEMPAQHIQILLGHSNLSTTQRYINQIVNQQGLQVSHRRLSPGDRL